MSARMAGRLASSAVTAFALLWMASVAMNVARPQYENLGATTGELLIALSLLAFGWIGALIVARQPHHPVGWLSCALAMLAAIMAFTNEYAVYGLITRPGDVPGAAVAAWLTQSGFVVFLALLTAMLLLFPTGRPASPRWAWVLWLSGVACGCGIIGNLALWPHRGVALLSSSTLPVHTGILEAVTNLAIVGVFAALLAAVASLVLRFRSATGVERQQIKWLMYTVVTVAVAWPVTTVAVQLLGASELVVDALFGLFIAPIPTAVGVAILKLHLYDIDRLISRTLTYTLLIALLATVYSTIVVTLGLLVGDLQDGAPSWTVAAATLAVAGLFQPARRRLHQTVDRRFNRRRYDAAETIAAFGARLHDELDPDSLTAELLAVVDQTIQPSARSVWLPSHARG